MKKLLLSLALTSVFIGCERKLCCVNLEAFVNISVVEKATGKDLLNPSEPGHINLQDVRFVFSAAPDKKESVSSLSINKPVLFQGNGRSLLRVFPTAYETMKTQHTVSVYWSDTDIDKIEFELNHEGKNTFANRVLVNNTLMWDRSKGFEPIVIEK